jgi:hypothetical protein
MLKFLPKKNISSTLANFFSKKKVFVTEYSLKKFEAQNSSQRNSPVVVTLVRSGGATEVSQQLNHAGNPKGIR